MCATCSAHLNILNFITALVFGLFSLLGPLLESSGLSLFESESELLSTDSQSSQSASLSDRQFVLALTLSQYVSMCRLSLWRMYRKIK